MMLQIASCTFPKKHIALLGLVGRPGGHMADCASTRSKLERRNRHSVKETVLSLSLAHSEKRVRGSLTQEERQQVIKKLSCLQGNYRSQS